MENEAVIVIRYGKAKWFDAVRGLETYKHVLLLKGTHKTNISPEGFCDKNGYQKVVEKIRASLP
jgi:tRNA (Thr-GGU) A37 N-methylase